MLDILFGALLDKIDARLDVHNQKQVDLVLRLIMGYMGSVRMLKCLSMLLEPQKIIIIIKIHLKPKWPLEAGNGGESEATRAISYFSHVLKACT